MIGITQCGDIKERKMDKTDRSNMQYVRDTVENEGFDYAFRHYSHFEEVEDEKFHKLRKAYISAAEKLDKYVGIDE
jgi:hypothetical protein